MFLRTGFLLKLQNNFWKNGRKVLKMFPWIRKMQFWQYRDFQKGRKKYESFLRTLNMNIRYWTFFQLLGMFFHSPGCSGTKTNFENVLAETPRCMILECQKEQTSDYYWNSLFSKIEWFSSFSRVSIENFSLEEDLLNKASIFFHCVRNLARWKRQKCHQIF